MRSADIHAFKRVASNFSGTGDGALRVKGRGASTRIACMVVRKYGRGWLAGTLEIRHLAPTMISSPHSMEGTFISSFDVSWVPEQVVNLAVVLYLDGRGKGGSNDANT
jgi:hypothetical protein